MKVEKTSGTKEVVTQELVEAFVLTLSREEAETLLRVCCRISGPQPGRAEHMINILNHLKKAGVEDPGQHLVETGSLISFCN
jgi:hypothetical protein